MNDDVLVDNVLAIKMLRNITEILNAIEHSDTSYIAIHIDELKKNLSNFEYVFNLNLDKGLYD